MAFNGSGTFVRVHDWTDDADNNIDIEASRMDEEDDGFATGLSNCITKDGQTTPTDNIPMAGFRFTTVGNATARNEYAAAGQIQDQSFVWCGTAGGTANALTLTPSPAITAYATGQSFVFKAGASPNSGATTIAISGLSTIAAQSDGAALVGGEIQANKWYRITLDSATTCQIEAIALSVAPFVDSTAIIKGSSDATKLLRVEVDGFTTATTRVMTAPNYDGTAAYDSAEVDVASATTTDIGAALSRNIRITGTTTITDLGTAANGIIRHIRFAAALILTHNGTSLIIPGAANITTAAGDTAIARSLGSGNWIIEQYQKATGRSIVSQYATGTITRDMTAASGNVDTTGLGFQPDYVELAGAISGTLTRFTDGYGDGSINRNFAKNPADGFWYVQTTTAVHLYINGGTTNQNATLSMLSDGFRLAWTKVGSPTGTGTIYYKAYKRA